MMNRKRTSPIVLRTSKGASDGFGKSLANVCGSNRPKNEGPSRIPPTISPITRDCPTLRARQPHARVTSRTTAICESNCVTRRSSTRFCYLTDRGGTTEPLRARTTSAAKKNDVRRAPIDAVSSRVEKTVVVRLVGRHKTPKPPCGEVAQLLRRVPLPSASAESGSLKRPHESTGVSECSPGPADCRTRGHSLGSVKRCSINSPPRRIKLFAVRPATDVDSGIPLASYRIFPPPSYGVPSASFPEYRARTFQRINGLHCRATCKSDFSLRRC